MSSTTQEFYIRKAHEADARGPFTLEQLASLAENGQVDAETYFYDAAAEAWVLITSNAELTETLFPAKKILKVKPKAASQVATLNTAKADDRAITVNDMLLAAEGRTEDTKDKADPAEAQARAANIGLYAALSTLVVLTAAFILPSIDLIVAGNFPGMFQAGLPILGALHLVLGVCLGLGAVGAYPTVRFAAMLSFGFTATLFFFQGQPLPLIFSAAASVGLYFSTICLTLPTVLLFGFVGLGGALGLAQHLFTH
ncbi:MAG: DUF4339 domain-containing protein [Opitutaceae bacterium]|jgi:hypothetical protein|nr:DUF4339 domain-containing protein [Opitutaceae bacterium]